MPPLNKYDSSDDDSNDESDQQSALVAKIAAYACMEDSRYFFHEPKYCHDIRSGGVFDAVPWWKQIVNGVIHNEETFLKFFCMLRVMFIKFALLFKDNLAFASNNKSSISTSVMSCTYLLH